MSVLLLWLLYLRVVGLVPIKRKVVVVVVYFPCCPCFGFVQRCHDVVPRRRSSLEHEIQRFLGPGVVEFVH